MAGDHATVGGTERDLGDGEVCLMEEGGGALEVVEDSTGKRKEGEGVEDRKEEGEGMEDRKEEGEDVEDRKEEGEGVEDRGDPGQSMEEDSPASQDQEGGRMITGVAESAKSAEEEVASESARSDGDDKASTEESQKLYNLFAISVSSSL